MILDLEDAVAPDAKPAAREAACAAAASGDYGRREVTIRVNGADTEWHADDLAAACAAGPDAIVVPKVGSADAVLELVEAMAGHDAPEHTKLWAMVETPAAMLHAEEIAGAADRLTVLVMGTNDLAKELYAEHVPGRAPLLTGLSLALLAARATGTAILDGVYNDVRDEDGFLAECRQGREMGFDGKTLIHPGQVEGANRVFAPSEQAVEEARGILSAWEQGAGCRRGHLQRPDDRAPARRDRPPHARDPRGDRGARLGGSGVLVPGRGVLAARGAGARAQPLLVVGGRRRGRRAHLHRQVRPGATGRSATGSAAAGTRPVGLAIDVAADGVLDRVDESHERLLRVRSMRAPSPRWNSCPSMDHAGTPQA